MAKEGLLCSRKGEIGGGPTIGEVALGNDLSNTRVPGGDLSLLRLFCRQ